MAPKLKLVLLVGFLASTAPIPGIRAAEHSSVDLYVATQGADTADGTSNKPFATPARAQQAARKAVRQHPVTEVTVWLHGGTYELTEPLVFGPEDTAEASVTYRAQPGEQVVLSGGQRFTGWKANAAGRWTLDLRGVKESLWYPRQLFINGSRRTRARTPNEGFHRGLKSDDARRMVFPPGLLRPWSNAEDIELVTFVEWTPSRVRLGKLDALGNAVEFNTKIIQFFDEQWGQHIRGNMQNFPFYFENALEMLDTPGEWYLDRHTGCLNYAPQPGERMEQAAAVLPRLEQLIVVRGTAVRPVRNLHFRDLTFAHADWPLPKEGFLPDQAGFFDTENAKKGLPVPASAIDLQYATGCVLENCRFTAVGGHALRLREGCVSNTVTRCSLDYIGGNGVSLGLFDRAPSEADVVRGNILSHCIIRRCGLDYAGCVGVWVGIASDTAIDQNELTDLPYAGVSCGWSWDRRQVGCRKNVI